MHQRGGITFLRRKLFVSQYQKLSLGNTLVFRKFRVSQNFMHKKGMSLNSVEISLSHSADKVRRRTLLCFEGILVSKIFKQRRGEASRFCRNFFHLTGPKKFRQGIILCFRKFLVGENILWIREGGGYHVFPSKVFVSLYHFIGEHFGVSEKFFYRKFSCIGAGSGASPFFVSQDRNENFCKGTLLFSGKFLVSKKFMDEGAYHNFQSKFSCLTVPKILVRESYCFWENFWF